MNERTLSKNDKNLHWTLIHESKGSMVDKLYELYKVDKEKARIFYFLKSDTLDKFETRCTLLFEDKNGDFRFVRSLKRHGITSTGKMYITKKTIYSLTYNEKTGFHYYTNEYGKGFVQQLTWQHLYNFSQHVATTFLGNDVSNTPNVIIEYMVERFGWIRNVKDCRIWTVPFNIIVKNKLYNTKALLRYYYKCPYPQAKLVDAYCNAHSNGQYIKMWCEMKKSLINIESLKEELYHHPLFHDTCRMARMVGKKVNCSWSIKRLKSEHDKWSKLVTQVLLETEKLRDLKIGRIYKEFAMYSGFEMLTTNHELLEEGVRMNHCVGTYSSAVDAGNCGIYRVLGYTLELCVRTITNSEDVKVKVLRIAQYMDIGNTNAPSEALDYVKEKLEGFNSNLDIEEVESVTVTHFGYDDMPF